MGWLRILTISIKVAKLIVKLTPTTKDDEVLKAIEEALNELHINANRE